MIDYVARAREASRRWREEHGLPPRVPLLSSRSFLSSPQERENAAETETESLREATTKTTETTKAGGKGRYAFPWPDALEGLGPRHIEAFTSCDNCGVGTWAYYGPWALCIRCVQFGRAR